MARDRIIGIVAAIAIIGVGCGATGSARGPDGEILGAGEVAVDQLRAGDCFEDPSASTASVSQLLVMSCDDPHDSEIYFVYDVSGDVYPGALALDDESDRRCAVEFESFVGSPRAESDLEFFALIPTRESWEADDRTVLCALFARDLQPLTGSMAGSGR
ncbi:MAG TPA: septum formation family protein [Acidimicrobiia bacterium]|nr:septum formation family protein [Acidimicrobiia bacterium]